MHIRAAHPHVPHAALPVPAAACAWRYLCEGEEGGGGQGTWGRGNIACECGGRACMRLCAARVSHVPHAAPPVPVPARAWSTVSYSHAMYSSPLPTAILVSSVCGLVDYEEAAFLLRVDPKDFVVWMLAFCGTLFFGIQVNGVGLLLSGESLAINELASMQISGLLATSGSQGLCRVDSRLLRHSLLWHPGVWGCWGVQLGLLPCQVPHLGPR
ncbi:unnamed protein product [Closterium sp. NIES-54]